eukprot:12291621-Prorocentrum_lima.AAC.1
MGSAARSVVGVPGDDGKAHPEPGPLQEEAPQPAVGSAAPSAPGVPEDDSKAHPEPGPLQEEAPQPVA